MSSLVGATITRVDAMPRQHPVEMEWNGTTCQVSVWREEARLLSAPSVKTDEKTENALITRSNKARYLLGWPDQKTLKSVLKSALEDAGFSPHDMPPYLRVRQRGNMAIFTNYGPHQVNIPASFKGQVLIGDRKIDSAGVTVMTLAD